MKRRIHLQTYTDEERHRAITRLRELIADAGGWIVDFQLFSNLALSVIIEITFADLKRLLETLEECNVQLSDQSRSTVVALSLESPVEEIRVLINLAFSQGDGELRQHLPAVPG